MARPPRPPALRRYPDPDPVRTALFSVLLLVLPAAAVAQEEAPRDPATVAGELAESLVSESDSTQRYALLLPPGYEGSRARPLLLVLDPRGRAVPALRRFAGAARYGWIVMSSHDTRSDVEDPSVNERALDAMLVDAQELLAVDTDRIYLAGFSGTARLGWLYSLSLAPHVAGLVGVGAGLPPSLASPAGRHLASLPDHFAFWGGSGYLDFNYGEVREMEDDLGPVGVERRRIVHYPGPHAWLPEAQAADAVAWLELVAMAEGLAATRRAWVDSLRASWSGRARDTLAAGDTVAARRLWADLAADFEGLAPAEWLEQARERAEALAASEAVARHEERRTRERIERKVFGERLRDVVERIRTARPPPDPDAMAAELRLARIRDRAEGGDPRDARPARRLLAQAYTRLSFYLPRQAIRAGEPDRALVALDVAEAASPGSVRTCLFRARAHARAGRPDAAFEALACVRERGPVPFRRLAEDPWLAPLHGDPRWGEGMASPP